MTDSFVAGVIRSGKITVGVAVTTDACRKARSVHQTSEIATIAIGRMLTAATLATFSQNRKGQLSLQILGQGRLGSMFADVNHLGAIRTMVRNPAISLPIPAPDLGSRRSIGHGFGAGTLSVIWQPIDKAFSQSTTSLITGEVDEDVAHFLSASDQVKIALHADLRLNPAGEIQAAGGVLLQAMPDADDDLFEQMSTLLRASFFDELPDLSLERVGQMLGQDVEAAHNETSLNWECRCNYERVLNGVRMLGAIDLADMVEKQETAQVQCEFCGQRYEVPPADVEQIYNETLNSNN